MSTFFENDYAIQFFKDHGYPTEYNDGMLAWLRDVYDTTDYTLPDLLSRYIREYGKDFNMRVLGKSAVRVSLVEPAATFTAVTPSSAAAGADTLLTSAGVHGLTAAVSVGASIYVSAGTGWTVGFHTITAIAVDTTGTTIQIDTPFDVGMGTPTIALANTEVVLALVTIPANSMGIHGYVSIDPTFTSNDTSSTSKIYRIRFGDTIYYGPTVTTSQNNHTALINIHNRGVTNSQVGSFSITSNSQVGAVTALPPTSSIDTTENVDITFSVLPAAENIVCRLERYWVQLVSGN